jgi:RND family efflux transporter MFP subunit
MIRTGAIVLAAIALSGCAAEKVVARRPIPVRTITVEPAAASPQARHYTGNVKAFSDVPVAFRVGGYVIDGGSTRNLLDVGTRVRAGQVLARVRQADYYATMRQAQAGVMAAEAQQAQARSKLAEGQAAQAEATSAIDEAEAKRGSAIAQVNEARHAVQQARAGLDEAVAGRLQASAALDQTTALNVRARADFGRARALLAARAATQVEYDAAKAQFDASEAQVEQARQAIRGSEAKASEAREAIRESNSKVAEAQGQLDAASAAIARLKQARRAAAAVVREAEGLLDQAGAGRNGALAQQDTAGLALGDASLTCPIDGVVVARKIEVGSLVGPGTPAFVIADTRRMKVGFSVPETDSGRFHVGSRIPFTVDGLAETFQGTVTSVSSSADSATRLYDVEIMLSDPGHGLKEGMVASVVSDPIDTSMLIGIPFTALVADGNSGEAVFLVAGGRLHRTTVKLGRILADRVEVKSGLKPGDVIVSDGAGMLNDGDEVEVLR